MAKNYSAAIVRKWRRIVAVGCTHGHLIHPKLRAQLLQFVKEFKPEYRIHTGDLTDTAAFRHGAIGTTDETERPEADQSAALQLLDEYLPTHLTWGNHDWRLWMLANHKGKAITAALATLLRDKLEAKTREIKCKTAPYVYNKNVLRVGPFVVTHGMRYSTTALRDTARYWGHPIIMSHTHHNQMFAGDTAKPSLSYNVGTLMDPRLATYAHQRLATASWGHAILWGEVTETAANVYLMCSPSGKEFRFPPGVL